MPWKIFQFKNKHGYYHCDTPPIVFQILWVLLKKWPCRICDHMFLCVDSWFIWFSLLVRVRCRHTYNTGGVLISPHNYYQVTNINYRLDTYLLIRQVSWFKILISKFEIWLGDIFQNYIEQCEKNPSLYLYSYFEYSLWFLSPVTSYIYSHFIALTS